MTCWKCGGQTPDNETECEKCASAGAQGFDSRTDESHRIDWDKVKTFDELKDVLDALGITIWGGPGTNPHDKLKRFFKD
jgi:hypothetical protein